MKGCGQLCFADKRWPDGGRGGGGGGGRCVLQIKGGLMREVGITDNHIIDTLKLIPWPSSPVLVTIAYHVENHGKVQKLTFSTSPFSLNLHAFSCDKDVEIRIWKSTYSRPYM